MTLHLNYENWKLERFQYPDDCFSAAAPAPVDGIHSFHTSNTDLTLDFLAKGFYDEDRKSQCFLVVFSGAISEQTRASASAPFFSGAGLAGNTRLPLLSISDPTLALDSGLTLGWYAGNAQTTDLLSIIAKNIDRVASCTGLQPVLIGGSGGGYAAINIAARLDCAATAIVWNPQTSIGRYYAQAGRRYIEAAYPEIAIPPGSTNSQKEFQEFLDQAVDTTRHHLPSAESIDSRHKIIFLQNRSDVFHMSKHAGPWLNTTKFQSVDRNAFQNSKGNILLFIGDWGQGHAPAPASFVAALIPPVNAGMTLLQIASQHLSNSQYSAAKAFHWLAVRPPTLKDFTFRQRVDGVDIHLDVSVSTNLGAESDFEYACYLYDGPQRIAHNWYRPSPNMTFKDISSCGPLTAKLYLRDQLGAIKAVSKSLQKNSDIGASHQA